MDDTTRAFLSALTGLTYRHGPFDVVPTGTDGTFRLVLRERQVHHFDETGTVVDLAPGDSITLQAIGFETTT